MPWELVVIMIAAVGLFLFIKNRRSMRSVQKRQIIRNITDRHPDATVDIKGYDERR